MTAIERIADWIEILEGAEDDAPLNLCPTEVVHLLFDLHILRETVLACEKLNVNCPVPSSTAF